MDFLDKQIAPPKSWEKFEDLARALFAEVWDDSFTQKNGRTGQAQHGVDVYGAPAATPDKLFGVQCKGKNVGYGAKATTQEFDNELAKAEAFEPALSKWIFATTAPNDAGLQKHAREVSKARQTKGKFPVEVLGWESILALISERPKIIRHFYPEHIAGQDALATLREASLEALASIDDVLWHGSTGLSLLRCDIWYEAKEALDANRIVRLTGEGGCGKSGILRRIGLSYDGPILALKDNRVTATSLQGHLLQLGITGPASELLDELGREGVVLCLIDGADRLLTSPRRDVVTTLFRTLAARLNSGRWKLVTTARDFQNRDLVATALIECGVEVASEAIEVPNITSDESGVITSAFPSFAPLLTRNDLSGQNRRLFLLRELLRQKQAPSDVPTEMDLAAQWVNADQGDPTTTSRRSKALSQLGSWLISHPAIPPSLAEFDPVGLQRLVAEGSVVADTYSDAFSLTFDVYEDWLIARALTQKTDTLTEILLKSGEPLWWLRAVRLTAQILLERGDYSNWRHVFSQLQECESVDPAWFRNWLIAPLYSEHSNRILDDLQNDFEKDDCSLLRKTLETIIVFETKIDRDILRSPEIDKLSETERYTIASHWKRPNFRSWGNFLRWSLPRWREWPPIVIPQLSEVARIFCRATVRIPNGLSQEIAGIIYPWLVEVEDSRHTESWDDHRTPFGLELPDRDGWTKVEDQLRDALHYAMHSADVVVGAYLERLAQNIRLERPRGKLLAGPSGLPSKFPDAWTEMCLKHFLPPRRRSRMTASEILGRELFSWHEFHDAGIRDSRSCYPPSPLRAGFAELFGADETAALRLFHRLEMRASVFWRWYRKCHDGQRPMAIDLKLSSRVVRLWGDETIYRWSRAVLGSHALGSAYLALDDWMHQQAAEGRSADELIGLVLQQNGLVSTAAICISLLKAHINTPGAIESATPFLGEPKLWTYDIRRHIDDQSPTHRIGYSLSGSDIHFKAVEAIYERNKHTQPLSRVLLLPFRLMAGPEAQSAFDAERELWSAARLADYSEALDDPEWANEAEETIARFLSDSDPQQIQIEHNKEENRIEARILPPDEALEDIHAIQENQRRVNDASRLSVWAERTRELGEVADGLTIFEAKELADRLLADSHSTEADDSYGLARKLGTAGIVGAAAVAAKHGDAGFVEAHERWILERLFAGAQLRRSPQDQAITVDESYLTFDPQVLGAWGLAALACRLPPSRDVDECVFALAVQRLHAVMDAVLLGLNWTARPDFSRRVVLAALDSCVIDVGYWWKPKERERAAVRTARLRARIVRISLIGGEDRQPALPPRPYAWRWTINRKWPWLHRLKLRSKVVLDWNRAKAALNRIDWACLCDTTDRRELFASYLKGLVEWTLAYSEGEKEGRYDGQFPFEWACALAREIGRFAAAYGDGQLWKEFLKFEYRDRETDLVSCYLDSVAQELMISNRRPDMRFWEAWSPAADWVIENAIPARRDRHDHLDQAILAAGLVGPYSTPIPPDWLYLEDLLPWIDKWSEATIQHPAAGYALLRVVERMTPQQRVRWYIPWLKRLVEVNGSDDTVWQFHDLGNRAAALLKPLSDNQDVDPSVVRHCLAKIADAGCNVAREIIPMFAKSPRRGSKSDV